MKFLKASAISLVTMQALIGHAQVRAPDPGQLLRQQGSDGRNIGVVPQGSAVPTPGADAKPQVSPSNLDVAFDVKGVKLEGVTLISAAEFDPIKQKLQGRRWTLPELIREVQAVTKIYRDHGYIAQTVVPEQTVVDGVLTVAVIEGKLGEIEIANESEIPEESIRGVLTARQVPGGPLEIRKLERAMLILNDRSGLKASASLAQGAQNGTVKQIVTVTPTRRFDGSVTADNTGTRSVGEKRVGTQLNVNNVDKRGGKLGVGLIGLLLPKRINPFVTVNYTTPIGNDGLTLTGSGSYLRYKLGEDFESQDIEGRSTSLGVGLSYPILRSSTGNLISSLRFEHRNLRSTVKCIALTDKQANALSVGLQGDNIDGFADQYSTASVTLTAGRVGFGAGQTSGVNTGCGVATIEIASSGRSGSFSKLNASYSMQRRLSKQLSFAFSGSAQLAFSNLDSSEQFGLGGPFGVRAYPASEAYGDQGAVASAELRYQLADGWVAAGFIDAGAIQVRKSGPAAGSNARNHGNLSGVGLSVMNSRPGVFNFSASLAWKLGNNPFATSTGTDSDGRDRNPRLLLNALMYF